MVHKSDPDDVFSIYFHIDGNENNNKRRVERISITSNQKQTDINKKVNILIKFLQTNEKERMSAEVIQNFFDYIVGETGNLSNKQNKKMTKLAKNLNLKDIGNFNLFEPINELNDDFNKNFNLLLFLQDLILVFLSKESYDFGCEDFVDKISYRNLERTHTECLLAIESQIPLNDYIGISKLCCPFCQKFLKLLNIKFRGGHDRYNNCLGNWRVSQNTKLNQDFITAMHDWIVLIKNNLRTKNYRIDILDEGEKARFDLTKYYDKNGDVDDIQLLYELTSDKNNSVIELVYTLHKKFLESEDLD